MTTPNTDPAAIAEHLAYEIEMLFAMANELRARCTQVGSSGRTYVSTSSDTEDWSDAGVSSERGQDTHVSNALVESFLIHFRTLLDFLFYEPSGREGERVGVLAKDYADSWPQKRERTPPGLKCLRQRVHEEVAHLGWDRALRPTPRDREWHFTDIAGMMKVELRGFLHAADRARLGTAFGKLTKLLNGS